MGRVRGGLYARRIWVVWRRLCAPSGIFNGYDESIDVYVWFFRHEYAGDDAVCGVVGRRAERWATQRHRPAVLWRRERSCGWRGLGRTYGDR